MITAGEIIRGILIGAIGIYFYIKYSKVKES